MQDGDAARALRHCARAISTTARDLRCVSRGAAAQTGAQQQQESAASSALAVDVADGAVNDTSPDNKLLEKLADARRKWMVTLYRYSPNKRDDDIDLDGIANERDSRDFTAMSSSQLDVANNDRNHHQVTITRAADFCPSCSSIVQVALEYTGEGKLLAEHRGGCASCDKNTSNGQARRLSRNLDMQALRRTGQQASGVSFAKNRLESTLCAIIRSLVSYVQV